MCDYYPLGYNWEAHISTQKHFCVLIYILEKFLEFDFVAYVQVSSKVTGSTRRS